jgi:hypothetical protein
MASFDGERVRVRALTSGYDCAYAQWCFPISFPELRIPRF